MKVRPSPQCNKRALTLLEVMVITVSLLILAFTLLAAVNVPRVRHAVGCVNQLKQMGLAEKLWEGQRETNSATTHMAVMALAAQGSVEDFFQMSSNELSNPKLLVCPADKARRPARDFSTLTSSNISYFVNPDAREEYPQDMLLGDDNLVIHGVRVKSGLVEIPPNTPVVWSADRHRGYGNVALCDGSVQGINSLMLDRYFHSTNAAPLRLAIP